MNRFAKFIREADFFDQKAGGMMQMTSGLIMLATLGGWWPTGGDVIPETQAPVATVLPGAALQQSVIGVDTRKIIGATKTYPYRAIVRIRVHFPKLAANIDVQGTGTLIGNDTVLTAGHVLYDRTLGGWATRVQVAPGAGKTGTPYGIVSGRQWTVPTQYSATGKASADLGVIKLATPIGKTTGYLGLTSAMPAGTRVTLAGYAVAAGGNLGVATGNLQTVSGGMATYTLDTSAGDSGSGLFSTTHRIGVVHTLGSSTMNEGVALTAAWVAWLNQWRAKATSVAANHLVTITKPLTIWQTVTFQRQVATARLGTVYRVRREYLAPNGYYYDALYDGSGKLRGVINRGAVTTLKATPVRQWQVVRRAGYTRWQNLYWTQRKGTTTAWRGRRVYVATRYRLGNGVSYASLYTRPGGTWLGFVNVRALG